MIEILTSGLMNSVQDLGRPGYLDQGIGRGGAMDRPALRIANLLAGNDEGAAAVEVAVFPFRLRFLEPSSYAVTGAACRASLNGRPLPPWWAGLASTGDELRLDAPAEGSRAYVAIGGGIDVPEVLRSRATDLKSVFGGLEGRALARGDRLDVGSAADSLLFPAGKSAERMQRDNRASRQSTGARPNPPSGPSGHQQAEPLISPVPPPLAGEKREQVTADGFGIDPFHFRESLGGMAGGEPLVLRTMPGAEFDTFTDEARHSLFGQEFIVSADNNRQGMRLEGAALMLTGKLELLSHGIMPGTIQVPPSGQAVIQLAEANTCGGYPKIGHVIETDLWKLGQAPSGAAIRFELISRDAAVAAIREEELRLRRLANLLAGRPVRKAS